MLSNTPLHNETLAEKIEGEKNNVRNGNWKHLKSDNQKKNYSRLFLRHFKCHYITLCKRTTFRVFLIAIGWYWCMNNESLQTADHINENLRKSIVNNQCRKLLPCRRNRIIDELFCFDCSECYSLVLAEKIFLPICATTINNLLLAWPCRTHKSIEFVFHRSLQSLFTID